MLEELGYQAFWLSAAEQHSFVATATGGDFMLGLRCGRRGLGPRLLLLLRVLFCVCSCPLLRWSADGDGGPCSRVWFSPRSQ